MNENEDVITEKSNIEVEDEEEIEQIFDAIEEQSKTVKEKFYTQEKQEAKFKFK